MAKKNIVLCSDGTGNRGGVTRGTNVWRLYQALDRNATERRQVAFYDDGVGTEDGKYLKLLGGAFGVGFGRNVKDLYKFLARNFEKDDDIYLFGFSRGAYTVRALAAFISVCGVVRNGRSLSEAEFNSQLEEMVEKYANRADNQKRVDLEDILVDRPEIKVVGVWDTVSALGLPFDIALKDRIRSYFDFDFKDNCLSDNVKHGFHALAIDDQRQTFQPEMWEEREGVEQVWFAGVHSNVGGGYPKQGMASVALDWMMDRVAYSADRGWGLEFDDGLRGAARHHANAHDKLYDSRAGIAAYYRYAPRDIADLTPGSGPVNIHDSVFDRIDARTLGYNPGNLPNGRRLIVVKPGVKPVDARRKERIESENDVTEDLRSVARKWVEARKSLHLAFVLFTMVIAAALCQIAFINFFGDGIIAASIVPAGFTLVVVVIARYLWSFHRLLLCAAAWLAFVPFVAMPRAWFGDPLMLWKWIIDILEFLLPDLIASIVANFIATYPYVAVAVVVAAGVLLKLRGIFRRNSAATCERLCNTLRS